MKDGKVIVEIDPLQGSTIRLVGSENLVEWGSPTPKTRFFRAVQSP